MQLTHRPCLGVGSISSTDRSIVITLSSPFLRGYISFNHPLNTKVVLIRIPRLTRIPSPETLAFFAVNIVLFFNPVFGSGIVVRWCRSLTGISVCLLGYILSFCSLGPRCRITLICLIVILSHMSISSGSV